jgi:hypothetical protein
MSAATRRQDKSTIKYMTDKIKKNDFNPHLFSEVLKAEGNPYSALEDVLMMCVLLGQKADGPIIETAQASPQSPLPHQQNKKCIVLSMTSNGLNT